MAIKNQRKCNEVVLFRGCVRLRKLSYRIQSHRSQRIWQFERRRRCGLHLVEFFASENLLHFLLSERLVLYECFGEQLQFFSLLSQDLGSTRSTFFNKASDFSFDFLFGF